MTKLPKSIADTLTELLYKIKPNLIGDFEPGDHFKNDLDLDSLDLVEFVARIEQTYRLVIPDEDLEKMISLKATVAYVQEKTKVNVN